MADASPHYHFEIGFHLLFSFFLLKSNSISVQFFSLLFTNKGLQFACVEFISVAANVILSGAETAAFSLHRIPATPASCNNNGHDAGHGNMEPLNPRFHFSS